MENQKVQMYLMSNKKYFPAEKMMFLKQALDGAADDKFDLLSAVELKDPTTNLLISLFLGSWGVDRFLLGDTGMGILKLLTGGCCGILTIIDWFTICNRVKEENFKKVLLALNGNAIMPF